MLIVENVIESPSKAGALSRRIGGVEGRKQQEVKREGRELREERAAWAIFNFSWLLARATAINLVQMRREVGQKEWMAPGGECRRGKRQERLVAIFSVILSPPLTN